MDVRLEGPGLMASQLSCGLKPQLKEDLKVAGHPRDASYHIPRRQWQSLDPWKVN